MRNFVFRGLLGLALTSLVAVSSLSAALTITNNANLGTYPLGDDQIALSATGGVGALIGTLTAGTGAPNGARVRLANSSVLDGIGRPSFA